MYSNAPGTVGSQDPPRVKAKKYVELLLCKSGEAVLAGEAASVSGLSHELLMGFTADALECMSAFAGLYKVTDQKKAVKAALLQQPEALSSLSVWVAHTPRICYEWELESDYESDDEDETERVRRDSAAWTVYEREMFRDGSPHQWGILFKAPGRHDPDWPLLSPPQTGEAYVAALMPACALLNTISADKDLRSALCKSSQLACCIARMLELSCRPEEFELSALPILCLCILHQLCEGHSQARGCLRGFQPVQMTRDALLAARDGAARAAAELTGAGPNAPPDEMLKRNQLIFNDLLGWLLDDPDKFVRSTVVEVCGLESATGNKLNGLRAVVKLYCAGAERYTVQFEDKTLGAKKIKPSNLRAVQSNLECGEQQPQPGSAVLDVDGIGSEAAVGAARMVGEKRQQRMAHMSELASKEGSLSPGQFCTLQGLQSRPALNGKCVMIMMPSQQEKDELLAKSRCKVQLCSAAPDETWNPPMNVKIESLLSSADVEWALPMLDGIDGSILNTIRTDPALGTLDNCFEFALAVWNRISEDQQGQQLDLLKWHKDTAGFIVEGATRSHCVYWLKLDAIGHHLLIEACNGRFRMFQSYIKASVLDATFGYTGREWSVPQDDSNVQRYGVSSSLARSKVHRNIGGGQTFGEDEFQELFSTIRELQALQADIVENELLAQCPVWPAGLSTKNACLPLSEGDAKALVPHVDAVIEWTQEQHDLIPVKNITAIETERGVLVGHGFAHNLEPLFEISERRHKNMAHLMEKLTGFGNEFSLGANYLKMLMYFSWRWASHKPPVPLGWAMLAYDHSMFYKKPE